MIVEIHTPQVVAETWDIPFLLTTDSDEAILNAAAAGVDGARKVGESTTTGRRFVYSRRNDADLTTAGQQIADSRAAADRAMENARRAAVRALGAGMSEREVARQLGLDRNTVRGWRGKQRG